MTLNIIDISDYQSGIKLSSLGKELNGAICKCTESTTYRSPALYNQYLQLEQLHLLKGIYHYAGSSVDKKIGDPIDESNFFLETAASKIHESVLMLDWEPYGYGMSIFEEPSWVLKFSENIHTKTNVWPTIYMDFNHVTMWDNGARTLAEEVAKYMPLMVAGGPKYNNVQGFDPPFQSSIHVPNYWHLFGTQYTSRGNLNGYMPIDLNAVYLSSDQWNHYANPSTPEPPHPPISSSPMHNHSVPTMIARGSNNYFGSISGGVRSHGGIDLVEREFVKVIQQQLIYIGEVPGIHDINSSWADGIFDSPGDIPGTGPTSRAVASFQRKYMPGTKYYGQVWWDDWTKLASF